MTTVEKIRDIEKEIARTQVNKATMSHLCSLRARLAKLRTALLDNKVEVYTFKGKMMNCGGVGQCNYCTVRIADGMDSLSERTPAEEKFLKKKPADYRLACQAFVNGDATVEALPGQ